MRKWNAVLGVLILVLLLLHGIPGAFQLLGTGTPVSKLVSWTAAGLVLAHTVIGVKLTWDTVQVWRKTGTHYVWENRLFWVRRLSGFTMLPLLWIHFTSFGYTTAEGAYRLRWFHEARLAAHLLLVASLALHILSNLRPLLISFGVNRPGRRAGDLMVVLSVLLVFMTAALVVYYLRWNVW